MSSGGRRRSRQRGLRFAPDAVLFWSIAAMIVIWALFGGDAPSRVLSFAMLALTGTWLLALVTLRDGWSTLAGQPWPVRATLTALLLVPILLLVPLPPAWWQALPGRDLATASLAGVGAAQGWRPVTLSVGGTVETALVCWWLAGLVLGIQQLSIERMRLIYRLLFGLALLNIAIGLCQVVTRGSLFDFYGSSHRGYLLGFFANKNHAGLFISTAIVTGYAAFRPAGGQAQARTGGLTLPVVGPVLVVIFASLLATNSRAGLVFGVVAAGLTGLIAFDRRVGRRARTIVLVTVGGVCIAALFGSSDIAATQLNRFNTVSSDVRWVNWQRSWPLVTQFWPIGAGIGSFPTLFMVSEQLTWLQPTYFNHAHNEYLEQLIELGAIAPMLWIMFMLAAVPAAVEAWRRRGRTEGGFALAGAIVVLLFLIHSAFDYPLRRPGTAVLFAVGVAAMLRVRRLTTVAPPGRLCDADMLSAHQSTDPSGGR